MRCTRKEKRGRSDRGGEEVVGSVGRACAEALALLLEKLPLMKLAATSRKIDNRRRRREEVKVRMSLFRQQRLRREPSGKLLDTELGQFGTRHGRRQSRLG